MPKLSFKCFMRAPALSTFHSLQNTFYVTVLDSNIFRKKNGVTYISFSLAELYLIIASYKLNDTASWPSHLYFENSYAGVSLLNQFLVVKSFPVVVIYNVIPKISLPLKMSSQIRMFWYWRNIIEINIGCCQFSFWKIRSQKKKKKENIYKNWMTLVVSGLHLSEPANTFTSLLPAGVGHWSMSTFCRSISMPLVPLK